MIRSRFLPFSDLPSFRTRVAFGFGLLAAGMTALLALVASAMIAGRMEQEQGENLRMVAVGVAALLADGMAERMHDIELPAAHGHGSWARGVIATVQRDTGARGVRVFVLDRHGEVILHPDGEGAKLVPPTPLPARPSIVTWSDGERYLTVRAAMVPRTLTTDLGWAVVVQQPAEAVLDSALAARHAMLVAGALAALAAAALGWWSAGRYARPLESMAAAAHRIERGDLQAAIPAGGYARELEQLASALDGMTRHLVAREQALEEANRLLESRVEERTAALARANEELDRLARRDALTGLHNRRSADERLHDEVARVRRHGRPLSALVIDIDHFKRINDKHGHAVGDAVLCQIAQRLPRLLRATDFVARQGGEEFLVLLPATSDTQAREVAEKLRRAIELEPVEPVGAVTASVGVATLTPEHEIDPVALLRRADDALYAAKRHGRNRVAMASAA